jgi:hypothetical protein
MQTTGATAPAMSSDLGAFVRSLMTEGHAVVSAHPLGTDGDDAIAALAQLDSLSRNELALDAPEFSLPASLWAARLFYQLCQFAVCRDIGEECIAAACESPCPETRTPGTEWSADLTIRHLPNLFRFARHLSNADPLVNQMRLIATAWPLSSVGVPGLGQVQIDSFIAHPALRRLYADRILAAGDIIRLGDSRVDDLLRADLGMHRELSPTLAAELFNEPL